MQSPVQMRYLTKIKRHRQILLSIPFAPSCINILILHPSILWSWETRDCIDRSKVRSYVVSYHSCHETIPSVSSTSEIFRGCNRRGSGVENSAFNSPVPPATTHAQVRNIQSLVRVPSLRLYQCCMLLLRVRLSNTVIVTIMQKHEKIQH